jgi:hypothetical protein
MFTTLEAQSFLLLVLSLLRASRGVGGINFHHVWVTLAGWCGSGAIWSRCGYR